MFFGTQLGKGVASFSGKWVRDLGKNFCVIYSLFLTKYLKSPNITAFVADFVSRIGTRLGKNVAFLKLKLNNLNI
ncbi:hypothetical protein CN988_26350 [Bacillus thuringiensis]|nr:hypothetical protein CON42_13570 [Bacillus thuringiensis]PES48875.1 hypothetical protein CN499_16330 [Bacillus thuringiensis]PEV38705.1 hypothetical protein CN426_24690 [Bacillus thuringiensis]PEV65231.1 hypothetical protein CN434_22835 [Bacillus thuringiensis]PFC00877.1 hypothetical protein CN302_10930 [Bacillus thuringiensis]